MKAAKSGLILSEYAEKPDRMLLNFLHNIIQKFAYLNGLADCLQQLLRRKIRLLQLMDDLVLIALLRILRNGNLFCIFLNDSLQVTNQIPWKPCLRATSYVTASVFLEV